MNIPFVGIMMLYLLPIGGMLAINSFKDIKSIIKGISNGDYMVLIERCAAPILTASIISSFYLY